MDWTPARFLKLTTPNSMDTKKAAAIRTLVVYWTRNAKGRTVHLQNSVAMSSGRMNLTDCGDNRVEPCPFGYGWHTGLVACWLAFFFFPFLLACSLAGCSLLACLLAGWLACFLAGFFACLLFLARMHACKPDLGEITPGSLNPPKKGKYQCLHLLVDSTARSTGCSWIRLQK